MVQGRVHSSRNRDSLLRKKVPLGEKVGQSLKKGQKLHGASALFEDQL